MRLTLGVVIGSLLPFVMGQGCPNAIPANETQNQKVYRVCDYLSADAISTLVQSANADRLSGAAYWAELSAGQNVCNSSCGYTQPCTQQCVICLTGLVDFVYNGDGPARKEIIDDKGFSDPSDVDSLLGAKLRELLAAGDH